MSVARRAALALSVVFLATAPAAGTVFELTHASSARLSDYRAHAAALDSTMWALRLDFSTYDDQLTRYVAVLSGGQATAARRAAAETAYQQAVLARDAMGGDLDRADSLTTDPSVRVLTARLRADYASYNEFADRTRAAGTAGDVAEAVRLATVADRQPSDDVIPTLDEASAAVRGMAQVDLDSVESAQGQLRIVSVVVAVIVALMVGALGVAIRRMAIGPIERLRARMVEISAGDGDLSQRVEVTGNDEFGQVAVAFNSMIDALCRRDAELAGTQSEREQHLQAGYEQQRDAEHQVRMRAQSVIDDTATAVSVELHDLGSQVDVVRRGAATIDGQAGDADAATRSVLEHAQRAAEVVGALESSLRQVAGITALIAGVADQTKLLALNATIEAARAGAAGRGFSVVANEVKDLAMATARSTGQIVSTVANLERETEAVSSTIAAMTSGISGVGEATNVLREVARQQFAVVDDLDRRVELTVERISSMTNLTQRLERRAHRRITAAGPVTLRFGGVRAEATLLDVAEGGLRCQLPPGQAVQLPARQGSSGTVEFLLGGDPLTVTATVVARRVDAPAGELGLEFVDPQPALVEQIRAMIVGLAPVVRP